MMRGDSDSARAIIKTIYIYSKPMLGQRSQWT